MPPRKLGTTEKGRTFSALVRLTGTYAVGSVAQQALTILLVPLYTAYLSQEAFGVMGLMTVAVMLLQRIASTPIIQGFQRFFYRPQNAGGACDLIFNLFLFLMAKTLALTIVFVIGAPWLNRVLFEGTPWLPVVYAYAALVFLNPPALFLLAVLRMRERARAYVTASLVRVAAASAVIIVLMTKCGYGLLGVVIGQSAGLFLLVILAAPAALAGVRPRVRLKLLREPLRYGYPLILQGSSNLILRSGDRYMIRLFLPMEAVGLYTFATRIASGMKIFLSDPIRHAFLPLGLKKEAQETEMRIFVARGATYFWLLGCGALLAVAVFVAEIVNVFSRNPAFVATTALLPILALSHLLHGMEHFSQWGLLIKRKSVHMAGILVGGAALNLALNFLLVPRLGLLGAAVGTCTAYLAINLAQFVLSYSFFNLRFEGRRLVHAFAGALLCYGISRLAGTQSAWSVATVWRAASVLLYIPVLHMSGFFTIQERQHLRRLLTLRRAL